MASALSAAAAAAHLLLHQRLRLTMAATVAPAAAVRGTTPRASIPVVLEQAEKEAQAVLATF
jgi:hypothetical protein